MKKITNDILYVGVDDKKIDLFEGQFPVPNGMAYNSYVIIDEKTAVFDTVDINFTDEWLANVKEALGGRMPDYLVVQHMEPDHSANIANFIKAYPETTIVSNAMAFGMLGSYFSELKAVKKLIVKDGDTLSLGSHELKFVFAPMVHWPEVMFTYDSTDKVLFSADAFGKFGTLDTDEDWACEARRYYFGIVGKFGAQTQAVLKKLAGLEIEKICALHGPILTDDLGYYIGLYDTWSSYKPEAEGVVIAYTSVYGHTKEAVLMLEDKLKAKGCKVALFDLTRDSVTEAIEDAFKYGKIVLATTTYYGEIFPAMRNFIHDLTERNYQNRTIGIIENGSWSPMAAKCIKGLFENSKDITWLENSVKIKAAVSDENVAQLDAMAEELAK